MDVRCVPMDDRAGHEVLTVIAKMTWSVSPIGAATIARPISPVRIFDVYRAGAFASLVFASDAVEEKPGTDVLLTGTAHPPRGDVTKMNVTLRVGRHGSSAGSGAGAGAAGFAVDKTLTVHGPRVWIPGVLGLAPGPSGRLGPTPLVWELAYGGVDATDPERIETEPRNPAGTGFLERRKSLAGQPAPVIEDARAPIGSRSPSPAGFAPLPPHWQPRSGRVGTLDESWKRDRAPLRPLDFDPRHHSSAPDDQWVETPLLGDEPIEVLGATPEGVWRFRLPRYSPVFHSTVRGETFEHQTHLDTLFIDADERRVELVWRARVRLPRKSEHLQKIVIYGSEALPEKVVANLAASVHGQAPSEAS